MKKLTYLAALLMTACLIGCGSQAEDGAAADMANASVAEETAEAVTEESTAEESAAEESAAAEETAEESGEATDKTTQLVDGVFTLYTKDGAHSVSFPSVGSIMGVEGGSLSGVPDAMYPSGSTTEMLNATYGDVHYKYDCGEYESPEEFLADKVPDQYTIDSYYSEGYEAGEVQTAEINGYTVSSQQFSYTEYDEVKRFWHVAFMTKAGKLMTITFNEGTPVTEQDVPLPDDWYVSVIEGMTEN